jgi:hypothetical protein
MSELIAWLLAWFFFLIAAFAVVHWVFGATIIWSIFWSVIVTAVGGFGAAFYFGVRTRK